MESEGQELNEETDNEISREEAHFFYDAQSRLAFVEYEGTMYRYIHNLQGDIVEIVDSIGNPVVEYKYDAWGKHVGTVPVNGIGALNPFRYRGYVWDEEYALYYLSTRYYSARICRFINEDAISSAYQGLLGCNMFLYCSNNPSLRIDGCGYAWETIWDIISLAASVAEVVANPTDPWAWAGLVGDVVDVALPFVGGLGETVDAAKTAVRVVDKSEDVVYAAKKLRRMADVADEIKKSTGAYIVLYEGGQHYIGKGGFKRAITSARRYETKANRVSAIVWAPASTTDEAFIAEFLLQSTKGIDIEESYNLIWSPGKKKLANLQ